MAATNVIRRKYAPPERTPEEPRTGNVVERIAQVYLDHANPLEETLVLTWASFGATFGVTRLITHGIRGHWLPFVHNISTGGRHLHHYNIGIGLLAAVGLVAVRGDHVAVRHPLVGVAYGMGTALIADEAALLLDLEDVYWRKDGQISVNVAVGLLASLGVYVTAAPFWRDLARELGRGLRRL